jgi:pimeloyl-ACP methyl ester carboxylesterase
MMEEEGASPPAPPEPAAPLLAHDRVAAPGATPERWMYVLHGIYGAGRNWASVMRRLVRERPEWGAVLVDLREHGGSAGFAPPHTLAAAAEDLHRLVEHTGLRPAAILGHSFGGKVTLAYARRHATAGDALGLWIVDSTPEAAGERGSAWEMLGHLRALPGPFASRAEAVAALEARGLGPGIAQWVSTNLEHRDGAYRWRLDLDAMEALLRDFAAADFWDVVESPPKGVELHLVKAEESSVLSAEACRRIEEAGRRNGRVHLHRVAGGHWVNADNPQALHDLLLAHL